VKRHYGIRNDQYKLIHFYNDIDAWELYDLKSDPNEMNNIIDDPEQQEFVQALKTELKELRIQYKDTNPN
jgi:arylsulfatase A-like enzyme